MPIFQSIILLVTAMFWIFVLWMVWKVVQSLKGIDETLRDIANSLREGKGN